MRNKLDFGIVDEFFYEIVFDDDCQNDIFFILVRCFVEKESIKNIKIFEYLV